MEKTCIRRGKRRRKEEDEKVIKAKSIRHLATTSHVPDCILYDILLKLPFKTLVRFKLVSKSWRDLISGSQFGKSHFYLTASKSTIDYFHLPGDDRLVRRDSVYLSTIDPQASQIKTVCLKNVIHHNLQVLKILGSCNGLMLISRTSLASAFRLWNPSTGEYKYIVNSIYRHSMGTHFLKNYHMYGLCYDSVLNDYKVVIFCNEGHASLIYSDDVIPGRVLYWRGDSPYSRHTFVYICTLATGRWRISSVSNGTYTTHNSSGLTINGCPHWVVSDPKVDYDRLCNNIIYFDTVEEKVKSMAAAPHTSYSQIETGSLQLSNLGGCLCATYVRTDNCFDIWAMKEYGVKESWTKLFVIRKVETALRVIPIGFINNGVEIVLEIQRKVDADASSKSLVSYNIKTGGEKFILSLEFETAFFH